MYSMSSRRDVVLLVEFPTPPSSGGWRTSGSRRALPSGRSRQIVDFVLEPVAAGTRRVMAGYAFPSTCARTDDHCLDPRARSCAARGAVTVTARQLEQHHRAVDPAARAPARARLCLTVPSSARRSHRLRRRSPPRAAAAPADSGSRRQSARGPPPGPRASPRPSGRPSWLARVAPDPPPPPRPAISPSEMEQLIDPDERDVDEHDQQAGDRVPADRQKPPAARSAPFSEKIPNGGTPVIASAPRSTITPVNGASCIIFLTSSASRVSRTGSTQVAVPERAASRPPRARSRGRTRPRR